MQNEKKSFFKGFLSFFHLIGVMVELFLGGMFFFNTIHYNVYHNGKWGGGGDLFYICFFAYWLPDLLLETFINWSEGINSKGKGDIVFCTWMTLFLHIFGRAFLIFGSHVTDRLWKIVGTWPAIILLFTFFLIRFLSLIAILSRMRRQMKMKQGYESL